MRREMLAHRQSHHSIRKVDSQRGFRTLVHGTHVGAGMGSAKQGYDGNWTTYDRDSGPDR
jgi:hypothetical protein